MSPSSNVTICNLRLGYLPSKIHCTHLFLCKLRPVSPHSCPSTLLCPCTAHSKLVSSKLASRCKSTRPAFSGVRCGCMSDLGAASSTSIISEQQQGITDSLAAAASLTHMPSPALLSTQLWLLADAAASVEAAGAQEVVAPDAGRYQGFLSPLVDGLQSVLMAFKDGLDSVHVPYSYGWSIVMLTLLVKIVTFPFTKQQVSSAMSVQKLKPQIDQIKARYGEDKDAIQRETSALYEKAGVNPLAGCLPALATLPIFFSLYRSLSNVTNEGLLTEGFYWIPTLAGPTSLAAQKEGTGTAWLFPIVDGAPPIGWEQASLYLILPVLLVAAQFASNSILSPIDPNDENANSQRALLTFFPLMIGWFSLNVPSGLSLYYFANTVLTSAVQIYLKKLGGVTLDEFDLGPLDLGKGRRMGATVQTTELLKFGSVQSLTDEEATFADMQQQAERSQAELADKLAHVGEGEGAVDDAVPLAMTSSSTNGASDSSVTPPAVINKRCKRKKMQVQQHQQQPTMATDTAAA